MTGAQLTINTIFDAAVSINASTGAGSLTGSSGTIDTWAQPSDLRIAPSQFLVGPTDNGAGTEYNLGPAGSLDSTTTGFLGLPSTTSLTSASNEAAATESAINGTIAFDTPSGVADNTLITNIDVTDLGTVPEGSLPFTTDPTGSVAGGLLIGGADVQVTDPFVNDNGLFNNSPAGILAGFYDPGNGMMSPTSQNLNDVVTGQITNVGRYQENLTLSDAALTDASGQANNFLNIDPLVLGLNGNAISLSNWIDNAVYFQSNVSFNPTTNQAVSDGKLHHTSWVNAGDGILVLPVAGAVPDITDTLSEYFRGGQYNAATGTYTPWADGLAALAALATSGATSFSAATSLTDPATGQLYFNELQVWQDANQNGSVDAGELRSLSALGITSISLVGSGNTGESIAGSAVTNRSSYTTSAGTVGEVAAVDLSTDTTGDVITTASGGVTIQSSPEGGPTPTTSFVDQSASPQSYTLSGGTLTDQTTSTTAGTGLSAVFLTAQGGRITVSAKDTTSYWLGAGTGAGTLTGGAGNTVFLINAQTVVRGGSGFNIADVTDTQPVNIDLMKDNLQEVIGGQGGGVFNASGANWNVFIQATAGNNIIIGGTAYDALSGGTGNDLIEAGPGGSVIHAGSGNDVIYGGSGTGDDPKTGNPYSDVIYAGPGQDTVVLGTNNSIVYAGSGSMTLIGNSNKTVPGLPNQSAFSVLALHGSYADYTLTHNADDSVTVTDSVPGRDGTVTMQNVTALDFNDIAQVQLANAAGMPVNDQLAITNPAQVTSSGGTCVIQAATLLANDKDYSGKTLSIRELLDNSGTPIARGGSGVVNGGVASLSADGSAITFTPTPGYTGTYSFRYHIIDSSGNDGTIVNQLGTTNTAEMSATVYLNQPAEPTDPLYDREWFLTAANIPAVWRDYTGAGVSVGIFDPSGNVDFTNPDLAANAGAEVKSDGTPGVEQTGMHATLVAGVIAAAADGEGAIGVAPGVTLSSESIGDPATSSGTGAVTGDSSNLMDWSKYDVVNNSFTVVPPLSVHDLSSTSTETELNALQNATADGRGGLGTAVVVAGGNNRATGDNTNYNVLSSTRYAIVVGGIDAPSDLGSLQVSGAPFSDPGASILVSAPANNVTSTGVTFTNEFGQQFGADYQTAAGTSFATPIVSGVVALMLQANPNLGWRDIEQILAYSAAEVDPTGSNWTYNGANNWNGGGLHTSDDYGFGEVDARAAVRLAETWQDTDTSSNEHHFPTSLPSFIIPTGNSNYITLNPSQNLQGVSFDVEHVDVTLSLQNVVLADLIVQLVGPTGETSTLFDGPTSAATLTNPTTPQSLTWTMDTVKDWGEQWMAAWKVYVYYAAGTNPGTGSVTGGSLDIYGRYSPNGHITDKSTPKEKTYVYTDEFGSLSADPNNAARSTLNDSGASITLNAAAVSTGSVIDLAPGSTDSFIAGRSLTIGANTHITTAYGGDGDDTFIAPSTTAVTLQGGRGDDTYQFNSGFGQDTVINGWGTNAGPSGQIVLGPGLDPSNLWLSQSGNDLLIQALGSTSEITVKGWYANPTADLQDLTLADGYQLTTSEIVSLAAAGTAYEAANPGFNPESASGLPSGFAWSWPAVIAGSSGNTSLSGSSGDDVFVPGPGNDTFTGNGGNDVYRFAAGDGQVTIVNGVSGNAGPTGEIALTGLSWNQLWFTQAGNNLVISRLGSTDTVTVQDWFASAYSQVAEIVFGDGSHLTTQEVDRLVAAESTYSTQFPTFSPSTATAVPWSLSLYQTITGGGSIAGLAPDYYGAAQGQLDLYVTGATGQLETWTVSGQTIGAENTTLADASGAQSLVDPAATVVGSGEDFLGNGERDTFLRYAGGQLHMVPASASGQASADEAFSTSTGSAMVVDASTSVVGGGSDFYRSAERTLYTRNGSGALSAWAVNAAGAVTDAQTFTYDGSAVPIDTATTVVGGGEDFLGTTQSDMFVRYSTGELRLWQATGTGAVTNAIWFTYDGASVPIDTSTTVVGGGEDFLGTGLNDIFVRDGNIDNGALRLWEATSSGAVDNAVYFTFQGSIVPIDTGTTIVGAGEDLLGAGQKDLFVRYSTGQLRLWQATTAGDLTNALWFTYQNGTAFSIDTATTVVGAAENAIPNTGDYYLFLRLQNGDLALAGFNTSGAEVWAGYLDYSGVPLYIDSATQVIATGLDQGTQRPDFTIHDAYSDTTQTLDMILGTAPRFNASSAMASSSGTSGAGGQLSSIGSMSTTTVTQNSGVTTTVEPNDSYLVVGTSGNDTLSTAGADSTMIGNGGDDIYLFGRTNVTEAIINGTRSASSAAGAIRFTDATDDSNLWFDQVNGAGAVTPYGTDLRIAVLGTGRSVTIDNWFASGESYAQLSQIVLKDGMTLSDLAVPGLMQAMGTFEANYAAAHGGVAFDPAAAGARITDPTVLAAVHSAWHH